MSTLNTKLTGKDVWLSLGLVAGLFGTQSGILLFQLHRGGLAEILEFLVYASLTLWFAAMAAWVRDREAQAEGSGWKIGKWGLLSGAGFLFLIYGGGPIVGYRGPFGPSIEDSNKVRNCTSAEHDMLTLLDAECNFLKADYDNDGPDFAFNLTLLHDQRDLVGNKIMLISSALANGRKEGYDFGALSTYDASGGTDPRRGFAYFAVPTVYGDTGRRSYVMNHTGKIFYRDAGNNTAPKSWPKDLAKEGWTRFEE